MQPITVSSVKSHVLSLPVKTPFYDGVFTWVQQAPFNEGRILLLYYVPIMPELFINMGFHVGANNRIIIVGENEYEPAIFRRFPDYPSTATVAEKIQIIRQNRKDVYGDGDLQDEALFGLIFEEQDSDVVLKERIKQLESKVKRLKAAIESRGE